jgi:hypothetical protein
MALNRFGMASLRKVYRTAKLKLTHLGHPFVSGKVGFWKI